MKRKVLLLILTSLTLVFASCGREEAEAQITPENAYGMTGTVCDTGVFCAFCPEGWSYKPAYELTDQDQGSVLSDVLIFTKDTDAETDAPVLYIHYIPAKEGIDVPDSSYYNSVERINPFSTGGRSWSGYSASVDGHRFLYITTEGQDANYEVWFWVQSDESTAAVTDADVQAVLSSLQISTDEE